MPWYKCPRIPQSTLDAFLIIQLSHTGLARIWGKQYQNANWAIMFRARHHNFSLHSSPRSFLEVEFRRLKFDANDFGAKQPRIQEMVEFTQSIWIRHYRPYKNWQFSGSMKCNFNHFNLQFSSNAWQGTVASQAHETSFGNKALYRSCFQAQACPASVS